MTQCENNGEMTEEGTDGHLSVVMTTDPVADVTQTKATDVVPSSSYGIEFYFQCAVIIVGVIGTAANGLILFAMIVSKQHKKQMLIFSQNVFDLFSSFFLIVTYALKLGNFYLSGVTGYWFCMLLLSENLVWIPIMASKANLIFITFERYLKAVYPVWSKKLLRNWTLYGAIAFALGSGIVHPFAITFTTSAVIDGVCHAYVVWQSRMSQVAYGIFYFVGFYFVFLAIFVFCYGRIVIVLRRQAKVMASHSTAGPSTTNTLSKQMQTNVIKTMIFVSAFYAISDMPMQVYYLLLNINANLTLLESGYYSSIFISFVYFCANPFIYAAKFEPVKRVLLRLIPCVASPVQPVSTIEATTTRYPHTVK